MKKTVFCFMAVLLLNIAGSYSLSQQKILSTEQYRPNYHFTPAAHWMNDPNGLVYYAGEYHLFYQYYPEASVWGPMHWGHAVSTDLFHWKHLPIALYPDSLGYIFSGSAVIDHDNTSGLGTKLNPPMVAIFAYHNPRLEKSGNNQYQYQGMAYSLDKGRTWKKYNHNPVVPNVERLRDFRDPKVMWNAQIKKWILTLAAGDEVQFYSSSNLIDWKKESGFGKNIGAHGGVWECPDLFPMVIKSTGEKKWVLLVSINPGGPNGGSATQYFVGNFDGNKFTPDDTQTRWLDYGKDNYAGVTWSGIPASDGRRIFLGWMSNWQYGTQVPTEKWRSAMTTPRELTLVQNGTNYILASNPVHEIVKIQTRSVVIPPQTIHNNVDITKSVPFKFSKTELTLNLKIGEQSPAKFGIKLSNDLNERLIAGYDITTGQLFVDRTQSGKVGFSKDFPAIATAPCKLDNNTLQLRIILDEASIEIFAQQGKTVLTNIFFSSQPYSKLSLFSEKGTVKATGIKIWELAKTM
jgi:fructan beta-fructosidase